MAAEVEAKNIGKTFRFKNHLRETRCLCSKWRLELYNMALYVRGAMSIFYIYERLRKNDPDDGGAGGAGGGSIMMVSKAEKQIIVLIMCWNKH